MKKLLLVSLLFVSQQAFAQFVPSMPPSRPADAYHNSRPTNSTPSYRPNRPEYRPNYNRPHYQDRRYRRDYNVNVYYDSGNYRRPYYDDSAYYSCKYNPNNCGYNKPYTIYGSGYYNNRGDSGGRIELEYRGNNGGYSRYEFNVGN